MFKVPKTMSTQHPDNASTPFFAESALLEGNDEVQEAYYVFSHLGIEEQMWDCEGKEIDTYVVKKLLSRYPAYFQREVLGKDRFLTFRVPNPSVEKDEAKFMLETLESIPRNYDIAKVFYKTDIAPVFEVILPMTTSFSEVQFVYDYYRKIVAGKEGLVIGSDGIRIRDWIGSFYPKTINVIPLFELFDAITECDRVVQEMVENIPEPYFRVFIARSDPALNYGFFAATLITHVALRKLQALEEKTGVPLYPIIGMGSAPFRGNLKPSTAEDISKEYSGCQTFTIQSAFKYDYPVVDVVKAVEHLNKRERSRMPDLDIDKTLKMAQKGKEIYEENVREVAQAVNSFSVFVPQRRMRKLHIGLFGYARSTGEVVLPRAITFCAACYSLGLPPELLDIAFMSKEDVEYLYEVSPTAKKAIEDAASLYNPESERVFGDIAKRVGDFASGFPQNEFHREATSRIIELFLSGTTSELSNYVTEAAIIRQFLG